MNFESIKKKALELGYNDVGITDAIIPEEDIQAYRMWLENRFHAKLAYMENEIRTAPSMLLPGAKSAILFISYYKQPKL